MHRIFKNIGRQIVIFWFLWGCACSSFIIENYGKENIITFDKVKNMLLLTVILFFLLLFFTIKDHLKKKVKT
mgnify:FL=1